MDEIEALVGDLASDIPLAPRYNIAPSQPIVVLLGSDPRTLTVVLWGLVPFWAKNPSIGSRLINARAETVDEKPAFRTSFKSKRCLILADGFFEWMKVPGRREKTPMHISLKDGRVFAFAGLWSHWQGPDGTELTTATIITTSPNALVSDIHNRMPAILAPEVHSLWLDTAHFERSRLKELLRPFPAEEMRAVPVSRAVNNVRHDAPDCIEPAAAANTAIQTDYLA
jgi:putative SOS response-associated peptidase YedK